MGRNVRRFSKVVEIFDITYTSDGFIGQQLTETLLGEFWAEIKTLSSDKAKSNDGLDFTQNHISILLRYDENINYNSKTMFVKYRNQKYTIVKFPDNIDFENSYIMIHAKSNK